MVLNLKDHTVFICFTNSASMDNPIFCFMDPENASEVWNVKIQLNEYVWNKKTYNEKHTVRIVSVKHTHSVRTGCTGSQQWQGPHCSWWHCRWEGSRTGTRPGYPHSWWCPSAGCSWPRWGWSSPGCCAEAKWRSRAGSGRAQRWGYSGCSSPGGEGGMEDVTFGKLRIKALTELWESTFSLQI